MRGLKGLVAAGAALLVFAAGAQARPTFDQARGAIHTTMDMYASDFDGHVIVGPCVKRGERSVVCRVRTTGRDARRYRVVVWDGVYIDGEEQVQVRAFIV